MQGYIELKELKYQGGGYCTYPLMIHVADIASVGYSRGGYVDATLVYLTNGREYQVAETYEQVVAKMKEAGA